MQTAPRSRQGSAASLIHSISGHVGPSTISSPGTVFEPGQNAISTLLQPPIVRTGLERPPFVPASSSYNTPTARDIPPVALTNIQRVEAVEFERYVSQVGALYKQLQRVKDGEEEARAEQENRWDNFSESNEDFGRAGGRWQPSRKGSVASTTSMDTRVKPLYHRQGSGGLSRGGNHGPPSLSIIPSVYFDEEFHLQNPRTFRVVSERSDVIPPNSTTGKASNENTTEPRKTLATNAILQEKLSWYMDIAEMYLIDSISIASITFVSALNSLRELHSEAAELVQNITTLRKDIVLLDESMVTGGLKLLQKRQIRYNLQQIQDTIQQLKRVVDGVAYAEALVDRGEAEKALTEIDLVELLIAGERDKISGVKSLRTSKLRDIRAVTLLQGVVSDLTILRCRIGKVFEAQVHSILIEDLRQHVQSISTQEVLSRWETSSSRAKGVNAREPDELRTTLSPTISGLHRSRSVSTAILAYQELLLQEIRNLMRKSLPSSIDDAGSDTSASTIGGGRNRTNQERSSILARNIRSLDAKDAERLFSTIFIGVIELLRRVKIQSNILLDIVCTVGNTDTEEMQSMFDVPNLLGQVVDVSHEKIKKILQVRSEQTTSLPLDSFLRCFTLNLLYIDECEAISGREGTSLKTGVNGHIQDYIRAHGDMENRTLAQGMSSDTWQDKDFTAEANEILNQILQCGKSDPPEWTELSKIWAPLSQEEAELSHTEDIATRDKVRGAIIDEQTFLLPSSAILCLKGTSHFLRLIGGIPSMTPDITMSLISYLQTFDSRCRQLILGAGAMVSVGFRNITTTHLAVALQAVAFIATIIPCIREFVRRHAPTGPPSAKLTGEFDKLQRSFQEHQESIYEKLVEIMTARVRIQSKKAGEIEWNKERAEDVRGYMADLVRDTGKLYKALSKRRPTLVVTQVMTPVFTSYKEQMGNVFKDADPVTETGRDCMLRDVAYLIDKFGKVEGFDNLGTFLIQIIKDKEICLCLPSTEDGVDRTRRKEDLWYKLTPQEVTAARPAFPRILVRTIS
ncbi:Vps54-like protein-domain-containing protein [Xylariales sp. PMI_506]|nr:Vps54-like protein-domain-containing protein [Xylariales sp. PMI_506]